VAGAVFSRGGNPPTELEFLTAAPGATPAMDYTARAKTHQRGSRCASLELQVAESVTLAHYLGDASCPYLNAHCPPFHRLYLSAPPVRSAKPG